MPEGPRRADVNVITPETIFVVSNVPSKWVLWAHRRSAEYPEVAAQFRRMVI